MAVARAAGRIVRADVKKQQNLLNVPRRGDKYNYAAELAMEIQDARKSLPALPRTLVAVHQSATGLPLYDEVMSTGCEDIGPGWVWDEDCGSRSAASATRDEDAEGGLSGGGTRGREGVNGGRDQSRIVTPISETQAKYIQETNRETWRVRRRLLMMCTVWVKAILSGRHLASHNIKGAQWARSKGTCRDVIDFCAEHGLWATNSREEHRETFHAKTVEDEHILRKDAPCAAFPFDNCDFDPRIGERQGEGPHTSTIAASSLTVRPDVDVLDGPNPNEGYRRYNSFVLKVRGCVAKSAPRRLRGTAEATCLEAQLQGVITPEKRATLDALCAFIMLGSTKSWKDLKAAIDRMLRIWRGTEAGRAGAPWVIAGDEETYNFLRSLQVEARRVPPNSRVSRRLASPLSHGEGTPPAILGCWRRVRR
ncbi:unnamed protein product [Pylaiella littoralis]